MSIVRSDARFYECSWVGQFRAIDQDKAKFFAQAVANQMADLGVHDVGYDVRVMPRDVLTDEEARTSLISHVRPESAGKVPHPWDQGLYIFPDDHPLHDFERLAREGPFTDPQQREHVQQIFLTTADRLELEAGDGNEED